MFRAGLPKCPPSHLQLTANIAEERFTPTTGNALQMLAPSGPVVEPTRRSPICRNDQTKRKRLASTRTKENHGFLAVHLCRLKWLQNLVDPLSREQYSVPITSIISIISTDWRSNFRLVIFTKDWNIVLILCRSYRTWKERNRCWLCWRSITDFCFVSVSLSARSLIDFAGL